MWPDDGAVIAVGGSDPAGETVRESAAQVQGRQAGPRAGLATRDRRRDPRRRRCRLPFLLFPRGRRTRGAPQAFWSRTSPSAEHGRASALRPSWCAQVVIRSRPGPPGDDSRAPRPSSSKATRFGTVLESLRKALIFFLSFFPSSDVQSFDVSVPLFQPQLVAQIIIF